ncbi:MAG: hypothetical protein NC311_02050 [Muribaculaceae bacterium]|nr:hypothetical protein [Muribaculaceae bacterium]
MQNYIKNYDAATQRILERAAQIDRRALQHFDAQYSLVQITQVLRDSYKDHLFRDRYVGDMQFLGFTPWPKGFCALSTIAIYNLYGGDDIWLPSAIKLGAWDYAPVVFLRELDTGAPFDTTGDQFAPLVVPYELGEPINKRMSDMRTPNKNQFINEIRQKLDR